MHQDHATPYRSRSLVLALALAAAGCQATGHGGGGDPHRAHDAYVAAINQNDFAAITAMLTDDVVYLCAGEKPLVGKAAVTPWVAGYLKAFRTHWDKTVDEFVVTGEWAFERYSWHSKDVPAGGGAAVEDTGWGLLVYHHDRDGVWRVARDAWGPDHAPAK